MEYEVYMNNKNKFGTKSSMIGGIIFYGIFTFIGIILLLYLLSLDNAVLMEVLKKYIDSGKGATIKTTAIIAFIYTFLGSTGCIIFLCIGILLLMYSTIEEINTLRRYLRKEKLFKQGLVSDMDDDEKPKGFIGSIRQLFSKSKPSSAFASKYTRKELRKMKRELKEIEKKKKNAK